MDQNDFSISKHFDKIDDPRKYNVRHKLIDIITIAICAIICEAETWVHVEEYGKSKQAWLKQFLQLPNGIASHDTFGRVFAMIDPKELSNAFTSWVNAISELTHGAIVAVDGKTVRRSFDKSRAKDPIHMVSAWVAQNQMVLGQVKTNDKSNEITAIPELIKTLELDGSIVTIDAMGCQKAIAALIIDKNADYLLALKGNQSRLHEQIELYFQGHLAEPKQNAAQLQYFESTDGDHGRIEIRRYWATSDIKWLQGQELWPGLKTIVMVQRERHLPETVSSETSYYICSLESDIKKIAQAIRSHWGIENSLHWVLDVCFHEDLCRVRKDHAPQNMATIRHLAINLLKQEKTFKGSIATKRLKCAWNDDYLLKVLNA